MRRLTYNRLRRVVLKKSSTEQWYVTQTGRAARLINECFSVQVRGVLPNIAAIAQLIERTFGRGEVVGLIPTSSTKQQ